MYSYKWCIVNLGNYLGEISNDALSSKFTNTDIGFLTQVHELLSQKLTHALIMQSECSPILIKRKLQLGFNIKIHVHPTIV